MNRVEIKNEYNNFKAYADEYMGSLRNEITDYVEMLESENKEMLDELISQYKDLVILNKYEKYAESDCHRTERIKSIIEKATGKTIEEVLNKSIGNSELSEGGGGHKHEL